MSSCTRLVTGSLYSDLKICQKQLIGGRNGQNYGTLKWAHRSNQSVFGIHNIWKTTGNWENEAISSGFGHTEALLLKKKDIKRPFFPPCRNWPIWRQQPENVTRRLSWRKSIIVEARFNVTVWLRSGHMGSYSIVMDPGRVVSRFDDLITRFIPIAKYFIPSIHHVWLLALLWDSSFIADPP